MEKAQPGYAPQITTIPCLEALVYNWYLFQNSGFTEITLLHLILVTLKLSN